MGSAGKFVANSINENLGYLRNQLTQKRDERGKAFATIRKLTTDILEWEAHEQETLVFMMENHIEDEKR